MAYGNRDKDLDWSLEPTRTSAEHETPLEMTPIIFQTMCSVKLFSARLVMLQL